MQKNPPVNETAAFMVAIDDGASIAVRRWGDPRAERLVISHGNGLAVDAFVAFGAALVSGFEVVAFDMRNHGRSPFKPLREDNWLRFIKDFPQIITGIDEMLGKKPTHGAFHSLSAASCLLSAADWSYPWRSLTLFEPPVMPPESSTLKAEFVEHQARLVARTVKRRTRFEDPGELTESFRRAKAFDRISDDTLRRLALATLRHDGGRRPGCWRLACPAAFEAKTYRDSTDHDLWSKIAKVRTPVQIVCGDPGARDLPFLLRLGRLLAGEFGFDWRVLQNSTHLMQLEAPLACARATSEFADSTMPLAR